MGLINLRTNLKGYGLISSPGIYISKGSVDLKFGSDEPGNGSSGQPFIQTRIPATDEPLQTGISNAGPVLASVGAGAAIGAIGGSILGSTGAGAAVGAAVGLGIGIAGADITGNGLRIPSAGTGGPDFLVRGGTLLPNILINDTIRLSKYFASTEGILFAVKQNLLSRIGTRAQGTTGLLNERLYTPISTLLGAVGTPFGLHVNKQGLNPLQGLGDQYVPDRYFSALAEQTNEIAQNPGSDAITHNKLYGLYAVKLLGDNLVPFYRRNGITNNTSTDLLAYQGGPGSFLGVGQTRIAYATDNVGAPLSVASAPSYQAGIVGYNTLDYSGLEEISKNGSIGDYKSPKSVDFRTKLKLVTQKAPSYDPGENKTLETRVNLGDPGNNSGKNIISYTNGYTGNAATSFGAASPNSYDKINAYPLYKSDNFKNDKNGNLDLVNFYFKVLDNDTPAGKGEFIHFRAFLNQINDSYNSNWSDTRYIGRGEKFYTYSGFDRKVSLSWTVAAQSRAEMNSMYSKLNFLASVCAPDYSDAGYMRGNLVQLTIGNLFYEQTGIITGFSYEMNDENSTWEIGIDDEGILDGSMNILPHLIKVSSFEFIPIHNFVPRKQQNTYLDKNEEYFPESYGGERYIASSVTPTVEQDRALFNLNGLSLPQIEVNPQGGALPSDSEPRPISTPGAELFGTPISLIP